ncbi:MAG: hypothetical protein AAF629_08645, partial [Chloroflexota bacterium]
FLDAGHSLDGTESPMRIFLTCYEVLQLAQHGRAKEILYTAYGQLQSRASEIVSPESRQSFLQNIPAHREIIDAYQQSVDTV